MHEIIEQYKQCSEYFATCILVKKTCFMHYSEFISVCIKVAKQAKYAKIKKSFHWKSDVKLKNLPFNVMICFQAFNNKGFLQNFPKVQLTLAFQF